MTSTDTKQPIRDYVDSLGLQYTATFQPTPQPADKVKHPQLHWLITLSKGHQAAQFPYHQGCGHVVGYKHEDSRYQWHADLTRRTCETGKIYKFNGYREIDTFKKQPAPDLLDVLYCLILDADVLNYPCYETWARNLGYEEDSRSGEKTYQQCIQHSLALKNLIGFQAIEKLQKLFQDY